MGIMEKQISSDRIVTLDVMKGVLIILVVIGHVLQYSATDRDGVITNIIRAIQMPGFFVISGYLCFRKDITFSVGCKKIGKSAIMYLVPFISWYVIVDAQFQGLSKTYQYQSVFVLLLKLLNSIDSGLWFLWVLFILSILGTIANVILNKFKKLGEVYAACIILIILLALLILRQFTTDTFLGISVVAYYSVFYFSGYVLHYVEKWIARIIPRLWNVLYAACAITFFLIISNYPIYLGKGGFIDVLLRIISGFTGSYLLYRLCEQVKKNTKIEKAIEMFGRNTLAIYVTHVEVCKFMVAGRNENLFSILGFANFSICLILASVFTYLIYKVINCNQYTSLLFYGKQLIKTQK